MWLSIVVYSCMAAMLFGLGWHLKSREDKCIAAGGGEITWWRSWESHVCVLLIAIIAGARYHTGFDHAAYLIDYHFVGASGDFLRHDYEWGFEAITRLFSSLHIHYFFYFAFWALLQFGFLYYAMRHHKFLLPWLGAYLFLGQYFVYSMNFVRQGVAEGAFMAMTIFIIERRFWPYALCAVLGSLIHATMLLAFPIYLMCVVSGRRIPSSWLIFVFFACEVIGWFPKLFTPMFHWVQHLLALTPYEHYNIAINEMIANGYDHVAWGPSRVGHLLLHVLIIAIYPYLREWRSEDKLLSVLFRLSYTGICLHSLLLCTNNFILRPVNFLLAANVILIPYIIAYLYKTRRWLLFAFTTIVTYSYIYIIIFKAVYIPSETNVQYLYHFFFMQ